MSNIQYEAPYILDDGKSSIDSVPPPLHNAQAVARPPIDYSSFSAFCHSTWRRFLSLWTRRFVLCLLAGQVVSLCITCTNVTTEELTTGNWQLPTTQTFFLYQAFFFFSSAWTLIVVLQILLHFHRLHTVHNLPVYALPLSIKRFSYAMPVDGFDGWFKLIYKDGWKCMFL
jgi:Solute carrier family 35